MDKEILAASKVVESPPKPTIKLNLIDETDRVTPLDSSSTNHSSTSASSTETLLTARERSHTELNVSNSKSPLCSSKSENQTSPSKEMIDNQKIAGQNEAPTTIVFNLDSQTGTYITVGKVKSEIKTTEEDDNHSDKSKDTVGKSVICRKESFGKENNDSLHKTSKSHKQEKIESDNSEDTDEEDEILKIKSSRYKRRSGLSDKSVGENGNDSQKSDDSDSEGEITLNTTEDLIAASMGLMKLGAANEPNVSIISDQLDCSSKGSISVGTDSSSSVLRDASRLYETDRSIEKVKASLSDSNAVDHHLDSAKSKLKNPNLGEQRLSQGHDLQVDSFVNNQSSYCENDIKEEDVSLVLKTSLNQFLSSRLSKSRNLDDSSNLSGLKSNSDSRINGFDYNTHYTHGKYSTPITNELDSLNDFENCNNYSSPSLKSFEHHEKGMRYLVKSRNGSKSSDYSSQESVIFPEGSFTGQCKHRDSSFLGRFLFF